MKSPTPFYQTLQALSLDVVAAATAVGLFAVKLLGVAPHPVWWLILPMTIWSFYTLDHLMDGFKSKGKTEIHRHSFHYKNRKRLTVLSALFGMAALALSLIFLDKQIIQAGLVMGVLVLLYFIALLRFGKNKSFLLQKELIIALVYVAGIWLAPLVWYGRFPETIVILFILVLFLLAWGEGIMASLFDYENDVRDSHSSFTVLFGKQFGRRFPIVLHILVFLIIKFALFFLATTNLQFTALLILAFMNLVLLIIILYPAWFQKNERYRIVGEGVFLLPALILFF